LEIQGGPWSFGQILFRGVLGVFRKSKGSTFLTVCVLLHFYVTIFWSLPPPPPPPLCASVGAELNVIMVNDKMAIVIILQNK
jgi:hypothetical protein